VNQVAVKVVVEDSDKESETEDLVSTEDKKPARWVRNLVAVRLVGTE
jgi:hypothetical protein